VDATTVTDDEAIKIARAVTIAKGWPWKEPIRLVRLREGILGFGRRVVGRRILETRSNANSDSIVWTILTAEESDRFVVGVFYGDTRPPRYIFFAIDKSTDEATVVADDTPYRPKVWR
jgi:hypothetical protein